MGSVAAKTYFPNDNTHTSPAGAQGEGLKWQADRSMLTTTVNAQSFVTAVKCGKSNLASHLSSAGNEINYAC